MATEETVKQAIKDLLQNHFYAMNLEDIIKSVKGYSLKNTEEKARRMLSRRPQPADFKPSVIQKFGSKVKASKGVTLEVQIKIKQMFGLQKKLIEGTNLEIDLFDDRNNIAYELLFGDGSEVYKDVIKAIVAGAQKLVVFCRSYPNPWGMTGYDYVRRQINQIESRIEKMTNLIIEIIDFMNSC